MKAFILAGGLGTRLRPLTYSTPKNLIPIGAKPILEHQIQYLKQEGVENIILGVGHLREQIWKYVSSRGFQNIEYSVEKQKLGTGGAIRHASKKLNDTFLVLNGDIAIGSLELSKLIDFHNEKGGIASILLTEVDNPQRYGVAKLEGDKIIDFVEKPKRYQEGLINAGIYILEPEILEYIPEGKVSLEGEVFPKLVEKGSLYGYPFCGYWKDIGVIDDYLEVQKDYIEGKNIYTR